MPIAPVMEENPYGLPPLNSGVSFTDEERRRLGMRVPTEPAPAQTTEDIQMEMVRSIARQAAQPGQDQEALSRAMSAAAIAVPMSEWREPATPLPISKRDQVRTVLESRERQLKSLERFASDPKNPVAQDEVERVRNQIEAEAQRALNTSTLPSPVAFYEQLVETENPEVKRAKTLENLNTIPGFKQEWSAFVSFDPETNEPVYPKWMEAPLEESMARAMGIGTDETKDKLKTAASDFALKQLQRAEPQAKEYGDDLAGFEEAHAQWENKMNAHFRRFNPEAAALLPTFAEEQGFIQPAQAPAAAPAQQGGVPAFNEEEVNQLAMRLEVNNIPTTVARDREELQNQIASGEVSPGDVVIVSTPNGAVAMKLEPNGRFRQVGRFSSRQ